MHVLGEVEDWDGHPSEVLNGMLDNLARLREQGLDVIDDALMSFQGVLLDDAAGPCPGSGVDVGATS